MEPRVILYTRSGCHLCHDARQVLLEVCAEEGVGWAEIDIDAAGDPRVDAQSRARLSDLVPVVEVDGVQVGYWHIKEGNVRMALALGG
ncbi:glutaredoxin family protein [Demequina lutea]|uniref:Glutaredoxin n=1 Tax=Demequina lutea TaxID=431489 RepID=A0A7Z0CL49_9MICO|nr:glutaredoxin family protein [Demequina lutea]NYI42390.1 glutaredoxin [Demequina lutea]